MFGGIYMKINKYSIIKHLKTGGIAILTVIICVFIFKNCIITTAIVSGKSMEPTLRNKDNILVTKFNFKIERGDIYIFDSSPMMPFNKLLIKRVIGLPNDIIDIKDGYVYVNNKKLDEPYLRGIKTPEKLHFEVPEGNVFVLGDNRNDSIDSRYIGPVPISCIKGHAIYKLPEFKKLTN